MLAAILGLMVAAQSPAIVLKGPEEEPLPVDHATVPAAEYRVPVSDSVRAWTWDELAEKPVRPIAVRMACAVWAQGQAGACVDAALLPPEQKTVDWLKIVELAEAADRSAGAAARQLREVAATRIAAALIASRDEDMSPDSRLSRKGMAVRVFEEVISPADARPPFAPGAAPPIEDAIMAKPVDGGLLRDLYPVVATVSRVSARVSITCRITEALRLLCRDPGTITFAAEPLADARGLIADALRNATYQLASTIGFEAKNSDGEAVAGRDYVLGVRWEMDDE